MFSFKKSLHERYFRMGFMKFFAFQRLQESTFHFREFAFFVDKSGFFT